MYYSYVRKYSYSSIIRFTLTQPIHPISIISCNAGDVGGFWNIVLIRAVVFGNLGLHMWPCCMHQFPSKFSQLLQSGIYHYPVWRNQLGRNRDLRVGFLFIISSLLLSSYLSYQDVLIFIMILLI